MQAALTSCRRPQRTASCPSCCLRKIRDGQPPCSRRASRLAEGGRTGSRLVERDRGRRRGGLLLLGHLGGGVLVIRVQVGEDVLVAVGLSAASVPSVSFLPSSLPCRPEGGTGLPLATTARPVSDRDVPWLVAGKKGAGFLLWALEPKPDGFPKLLRATHDTYVHHTTRSPPMLA